MTHKNPAGHHAVEAFTAKLHEQTSGAMEAISTSHRVAKIAADAAALKRLQARTPGVVESWSMHPQDYAAELVQMFGRYVNVTYLRSRNAPNEYKVRLSMHCYDPDDRMQFIVEAEVAPDGSVRSHGGNWILNESNALGEAYHFAEKAPQAYAKVVL